MVRNKRVKNKKVKTIKECFKMILEGNKKNSHSARLALRKIVYGKGSSGDYESIANIIRDALKTYEKIKEGWRQEEFMVALATIYFLRDYEKYPPDHLFPLLIGSLQHSNGNIRYAVVRMLRDEIAFLTVYLRIPERETEKNREEKLKFDSILYWLYVGLFRLSAAVETWKEIDHEKYEYIDEMPSSSYKSIQLVFADLIEMCGEENLNSMRREMILHGDDLKE